MTIKEIEKLEKEFTEKAQKFYDEYQETGMNGKYNSYVKYDDLSNICRLAIKHLEGKQDQFNKRQRNYLDFLGKLVDKQYSLNELKKIVDQTLYF
jgi:hypothetical protein